MKDRAMVVVAAGSSSRFGSDKLMEEVAGRPLIAHTISRVVDQVDECVLVARNDLIDRLDGLGLGVDIVPGGETRTESEALGLAATGPARLIGIHDGARPAVEPEMIDRLFSAAMESGGAVPGIPPARPLVYRDGLAAVAKAIRVQTPQVFWGPELKAAFRSAAAAGYVGHDTADIVHNFTSLEIVVVPGDTDNVKVTYPEDLEIVRDRLD